MMTITIEDRWIFKAEARKLLGVGPARLNDFIASGRLGFRELPGARARVRLADVEALLARSTRPATTDPEVMP